jgi:hypothetical protein
VYASSTTALATGSALTFSGTDLILGSANPNFQGSSATGSATLINNNGGAYMRVYGGSHATKANYTEFVNGSSTSTFTSAGYLGLGTSSPTTPLQIQSAAATGVNSIYCTGSTTSYNFWTISNTSGQFRLGVDSSAGGALANGTTAYSSVIGSVTATSLHFATNGTSRMTLDTSGALTLSIGTFITGNVTPLTCASVASNAGTAAVWDGSGNLYKLASSLRYKENITDWNVTDEQLNAFINLNPKLWDYIGKESGCGGFIAEDIEALGLKNAYNTSPLINYSNEGQPDSNRDFALIALQHKVLQKQQALIESLKARLDAANL